MAPSLLARLRFEALVLPAIVENYLHQRLFGHSSVVVPNENPVEFHAVEESPAVACSNQARPWTKFCDSVPVASNSWSAMLMCVVEKRTAKPGVSQSRTGRFAVLVEQNLSLSLPPDISSSPNVILGV